MRRSALERIYQIRLTGKKLPMHADDVLKRKLEATTLDFIERMSAKFNITMLEYLHGESPPYYKFQCNACHTVSDQFHKWYFYCPKCNVRHRSEIELEIIEHIRELSPNITIIHNSRSILPSKKELDLYFPDHNVAVEFNGLYWHGELQGKDRMYHISKTTECDSMGIQLIHIFEDEWKNYRKMVLDKIAQRLHISSSIKIAARQCQVREVNFKECAEFLNSNHLQGTDSSPIRVGLYYGEEIISVMTFSHQNASRGIKVKTPNVYELSRFAVKGDVLCVGGASKLFSYFIRTYAPHAVVSYADRRWSSPINNLYNTLGFSYVGVTNPNYWYYKANSSDRRYHRFNYTKKKVVLLGGDPQLTEWENMKIMGFNRIWDCGSFKYKWTTFNNSTI